VLQKENKKFRIFCVLCFFVGNNICVHGVGNERGTGKGDGMVEIELVGKVRREGTTTDSHTILVFRSFSIK
jgi:hypothetical protein